MSLNLRHGLPRSITANLTVFTHDDPEVAYPNQDAIWKNFEEAFKALWGLVTYAPVFREYYYRGLQEFYADNVMYLELRALLPEVRSKATPTARRGQRSLGGQDWLVVN